jgi:protein involved in polysaccharide export with SLBB domain
MTVTFEDGAYDLYIGDKVIIKPTDKKSFFKAFAKYINK